MTIACLIVEDQAPAQRILTRYIEELPHLSLAGICGTAFEAMAFLHRQQVDLLFLDLNLPKLGGFDFLRSLGHPPKVIVTTAYPQHALEAFDLAVVDYLVKPIAFDRFIRAVDRVSAPSEIDPPTEQRALAPVAREIFVKVGSEHRRLDLDDVLFMRAEGDYVTIVTTLGKLFVSGPLARWEQRLPPEQFVRVHKSYIVNLGQVQHIAGSILATPSGGVPIGRHYRQTLLERVAGQLQAPRRE